MRAISLVGPCQIITNSVNDITRAPELPLAILQRLRNVKIADTYFPCASLRLYGAACTLRCMSMQTVAGLPDTRDANA